MAVFVTGKSKPLNQAALIRPTNGRWTQQVMQVQGTTGQQRIRRASVSKLVDLLTFIQIIMTLHACKNAFIQCDFLCMIHIYVNYFLKVEV